MEGTMLSAKRTTEELDAVDPEITKLDAVAAGLVAAPIEEPPKKKRKPVTQTPWTPTETALLNELKATDKSWAEVCSNFPERTPGAVKVRISLTRRASLPQS